MNGRGTALGLLILSQLAFKAPMPPPEPQGTPGTGPAPPIASGTPRPATPLPAAPARPLPVLRHEVVPPTPPADWDRWIWITHPTRHYNCGTTVDECAGLPEGSCVSSPWHDSFRCILAERAIDLYPDLAMGRLVRYRVRWDPPVVPHSSYVLCSFPRCEFPGSGVGESPWGFVLADEVRVLKP